MVFPRTTHTFAVLSVSKSAYGEIKKKLEAAGYQDQFQEDDGKILIDMHGIALECEDIKQSSRRRSKKQEAAMQRLIMDAPHGRY